MIMKKRIFIFGIFSLFINISFLASKNDEQEIPKYKLIFLGDAMVGKSCILKRFMNDAFSEKYDATIGLDFQSKNVQIDNQDIYLLLYDTAGQEKFRNLFPMYIRDKDIILLVYDVTSKESFLHLSDWLKIFTDNKIDIKDKIFAVVGNKTDLNDKREVSAEEGKKFADKNGFIFVEVSAKTNNGDITELFDKILKEMPKKESGYKPQPILPLLQNIKEQGFGGKIKPEVEEKNCCEWCC